MKIQRLSIQEVLRQNDKDPIWCLNNTPMKGYPGNLLISIPKRYGNGQPDPIHLPRTWLPIDITLQVPRSQIVESSEFLRAVQSETIIVVSSDYAQYLMNKEGAREEMQRLEQEKQKSAHAAARLMTNSVPTYVAGNQGAEDQNGFEPMFITKVQQWNSMEDIAVLNQIRASKFKAKQLRYIAENLKNHPKTVTAITAALAKKASKK